MELLKLLLVFGLMGLLCKTIDAHQTDENRSFSVEKIWRDYHKKPSPQICPIKDAPWVKGVEGHYWGCYYAILKFLGKARKEGDVAIKGLRFYIEKNIYLLDSNSTIVVSSATGILNGLSRCIKLRFNGLNIIIEFNKVVLLIVGDFAIVAESLAVYIGDDLVGFFIDALKKFGRVFSKYMHEFLESCDTLGCSKEIDYECVLKELQKLMNTVARIDETLLKECENASQQVHEAVLILNLLYGYMAISVQGIYSCVLNALNDSGILVPPNVKSCILAFEDALVQLIKAICDVVFPLAKTITALLTVFVNITTALNSTVKNILGLVGSVVDITIGQIRKSLLKDGTTGPSTKERPNILKGLLGKK